MNGSNSLPLGVLSLFTGLRQINFLKPTHTRGCKRDQDPRLGQRVWNSVEIWRYIQLPLGSLQTLETRPLPSKVFRVLAITGLRQINFLKPTHTLTVGTGQPGTSPMNWENESTIHHSLLFHQSFFSSWRIAKQGTPNFTATTLNRSHPT